MAIPYDKAQHHHQTEISLLMEAEKGDKVMALKGGPPLLHPEDDKFNPEKDVWVCHIGVIPGGGGALIFQGEYHLPKLVCTKHPILSYGHEFYIYFYCNRV